MSKILARFKRAASTSSDDQPLPSSPRRSASASDFDDEDDESHTVLSSNSLSPSGRTTLSGSHFIEEFGDGKQPPLSPLNSRTAAYPGGTLTPSPSKRSGLELPESASKPLGTPKLTLTNPEAHSPSSLLSSPGKDSPAQPRSEGLGLGISTHPQTDTNGARTSSIIVSEDATGSPSAPAQQRQNSKSNLSIASAPAVSTARDPSELSVDPETRKHRSGSIISRLKAGGTSPRLSPTHLDVSNKHTMSSKEKRHRRLSASSGKAKTIAAAIVGKAGHNITGMMHSSSADDAQSRRHSLRNPHTTGADDNSVYADDDEDEDDSGSELDDDLPVTGFAVASNRRNADFHAMFRTVDEGDYLIEDYGCALSKDILVQGRLYVSENHICFHANIFGWVTDVVIPFSDIRLVEKKMTALVIPNAIGISTAKEKYTFASFISRDTTFDVMMNIWRLCNPNAVMSSLSLATTSRPPSVAGTDAGDNPVDGTKSTNGGSGSGKGHAPTQCACGKEGKHYSETALETTLASTPEKIHNLMFASEWLKTFLTGSQKLRELEMSDWKPMGEGQKLLTRSMTYIKPLNGSIGPKQTKCHIIDEQEHYDPDNYISVLTTTRTPDVPSGGVFSVKTKTCLMWAGSNSTKVVVSTAVEWTGKSWVKGIIEKSCMDGQKAYQGDIAQAIRSYVKENPGEFGAPEDTDDADATTAKGAAAGETDKRTAAEAYAAENRKKRQDDELGYLQGGFDKVVSGFGAVGSGLSAVFESVGDLISDLPVGKEVILGTFILLLLASNIYTYMAFKGRAPERLARRQGRENDLSEVVRLLLEKSGHGHDQHAEHIGEPRREVAELMRLLDVVEARADKLRSAISHAGGEIRHGYDQQD